MDETAMIAERVLRVRERIAAACAAAGRDPEGVTLVAVSKTQPPEAVRDAWTEAYTCLLETVNSPGALAMVVNMEGHPAWGAAVAAHGAGDLPAEYQGQPRLVVPTVRSVAAKGHRRLKVCPLHQVKNPIF